MNKKVAVFIIGLVLFIIGMVISKWTNLGVLIGIIGGVVMGWGVSLGIIAKK